MDIAVKYPEKYIECCEDLDLELLSGKSFEMFIEYLKETDTFGQYLS